MAVALVSETNGAGSKVSTSANMSQGESYATGCLDNASGALVLLPLSHETVNLLGCGDWHLCII